MNAKAALLALSSALAAVAVAAPQGEPYYLGGHYQFYHTGDTRFDLYPVYDYSDHSPWYVQSSAAWADPKLVKWGATPVEHNGRNYYCYIDKRPPTGSNIPEVLFVCGDPETTQAAYNNNWDPRRLLYGTF